MNAPTVATTPMSVLQGLALDVRPGLQDIETMLSSSSALCELLKSSGVGSLADHEFRALALVQALEACIETALQAGRAVAKSLDDGLQEAMSRGGAE